MGRASVAWLARRLGIRLGDLTEPSGFEERLRIQKAVFLLKLLGVRPYTRYRFSLHIYGPYSPDLAQDYYSASEVAPRPVELGEGRLELVKWFVDHSAEWLEVASTILAILEADPGLRGRELFRLLQVSKPWVDWELFNRVVGELKDKGLLG